MSKAKRPTNIETELAKVAACREDPTSPSALVVLRDALERRSSFAVAAAAKLVGEGELEALAPLLAAAYARIADHDPGCQAKTAIVETLCRIGRDEGETFLHASTCRQLEAAWGPPVDTAAALRGHAAAGLASMLHPEAGVTIAGLLADPEWVARSGAARAAPRLPSDVAVPLLVLKATVGDSNVEVLGDCFGSLLDVAPERMLRFVAERLEAEEGTAEQAALALGESRLETAFVPLREYSERATGARRGVALLALALLRRDEAYAYLYALVGEADTRTAALALDALAVHKHDARVRDAALAAARARGDRAILAKAEQAFAA